MQRLLATAIFVYVGLSAAHFGPAASWVYAPPVGLWCGNVVSDPYALLINVVGPSAAVCAVTLARRCIKARRRPCFAVAAILSFTVASACLAYEGHLLAGYGFEIGRAWWVPWW